MTQTPNRLPVSKLVLFSASTSARIRPEHAGQIPPVLDGGDPVEFRLEGRDASFASIAASSMKLE